PAQPRSEPSVDVLPPAHDPAPLRRLPVREVLVLAAPVLEAGKNIGVAVEAPAGVCFGGRRALAGAMPVRELAAGSRAAGLVSRRATLHARRRSASGAKAAPAEHQIGQACLRPPLRERRRLL